MSFSEICQIFAEVEIIFQTVSNLHIACPNHTGDWYFTGNYPTLGGNLVANRAFINYCEGKKGRAYYLVPAHGKNPSEGIKHESKLYAEWVIIEF